jgi:hypothetical protein
MSVLLSVLYVLAIMLGSVILLIAAAFGTLVVHAYFDRRPGYSYFAGRVGAPKTKDDDSHDF